MKYYLIKDINAFCISPGKDTKIVELTEEELGYIAEVEKVIPKNKQWYENILSAERKIRKVLDNEKETK